MKTTLPFTHTATRLMVLLVAMNLAGFNNAYAIDEGDLEWAGEWGHVSYTCPFCGYEYVSDEAYESISDAFDFFNYIFCEDCGGCSIAGEEDCWYEHHCYECSKCVDDGEYCDFCFDNTGYAYCEDCSSQFDGSKGHCEYCHFHLGLFDDECYCEFTVLEGYRHCTDCVEMTCESCGADMIVGGNVTPFGEEGCMEHSVCGVCLNVEGIQDGIHCVICGSCQDDVCSECNRCEEDRVQHHCPECDECFGDYLYLRCHEDGEHCIHCCEDNDWICEQCGRCTEGIGIDKCIDCGLCDECCEENTEEYDCTHGYCVLSSDFEDHLCPSCMNCPDDTECEFCGLCEDCQDDYHCEHGICPDGDEWDEHVCPDCGDCFDLSELCEYCGLCESCNNHCEHDICPEDAYADMADDHFTCEQCANCYTEDERCPICKLCLTCSEANTNFVGCIHKHCLKSPEFMAHWCYADNQCLDFCQHIACEHADIASEWFSDDNAHWQICNDCGRALNESLHIEGEPETYIEPDYDRHRNGSARVYCSVCDYFMAVASVPCIEAPADGSPYIITQPRSYTGNVNYYEPEIYATFRVKAGGNGLKYQWYEFRDNSAKIIQDDTEYDEPGYYRYRGSQTSTLSAYVDNDACDPIYQDFKYFCEVSNEKGVVRSDTIWILAKHVFNRFECDDWYGDATTHSKTCKGACNYRWDTAPHRWGEWTLVREATESATGLREQTCIDCNYKKNITIQKVAPGHVHVYDHEGMSDYSHWYFCVCGRLSPEPPAEHVFKTIVLKEATEHEKGTVELQCTICTYYREEQTDKLPHTHQWYYDNFIVPDYTNSRKAGYSPVRHFVRCMNCDQIKSEKHEYEPWSIGAAAKPNKTGRINRQCRWCPYVQYEEYKYGTYPIMVSGGTANKKAAAPGEIIAVSSSLIEGIKWEKGKSYWKDMSSEGIGLVPITKKYNENTEAYFLFYMPEGPVGLEWYGSSPCYHNGNYTLGERVEASCTGYGHEPDKLCFDCGAVKEKGARIEPTGHDMETVPGTEVVEYCTWQKYPTIKKQANPAKYGYSGDQHCKRCDKTLKGKKTPTRHALSLMDNDITSQAGFPKERFNVKDAVSATCTNKGFSGETYCYYCSELVEKGRRTASLGHEWGEWETFREGTEKQRGMQERFCLRDSLHRETRLIGYSGPDYVVKANKTKLNFEFTYGETPSPQTIEFQSKGRNEVTGISFTTESSKKSTRRKIAAEDIVNLSTDGLTLTVTPNVDAMLADLTAGEKLVLNVATVNTEEGELMYSNNLSISISTKISKADPNIRMERDSRIGRPGVAFTPSFTTDAGADATLGWKSSNSAVAVVGAGSGTVTPLSGGTATITASFEGSDLYIPAKKSYTLDVIGRQDFDGSIWQELHDSRTGMEKTTNAVSQSVRIEPSAKGAGMVDITYSGFTMPVTETALPQFTVSGVKVTDNEDGTVIYELPAADGFSLTFGEGAGMQTYVVELQGSHLDAHGLPMLKLMLNGVVRDIVWFGPEGMTLDDIIATGLRTPRADDADGHVFNTIGQRVSSRHMQRGIYIKDGKKTAVKSE